MIRSNALGLQVSVSDPIPPLAASIISDISSGVRPLTVSFGISVSSGAIAAGTSVRWNFGDGTSNVYPYVSGQLSVSHTFLSAGTFQVSATVVGTDGQQHSLSGECNIY